MVMLMTLATAAVAVPSGGAIFNHGAPHGAQ